MIGSPHVFSLSPYISIVLYRVTLVQDPVSALHTRTTLQHARRLKLGLALRLLCKGLFYGRSMFSPIFSPFLIECCYFDSQ